MKKHSITYMLKNKRLKPCAQVNLTMAPEVGQAFGFSIQNTTVDRVITNEKMKGGISVGGSAIFTLISNIHTMLKETV